MARIRADRFDSAITKRVGHWQLRPRPVVRRLSNAGPTRLGEQNFIDAGF